MAHDTAAPSDDTIRRRLLEHLRAHPDTAYRSHELAQALGYDDDNDHFLAFCDVLADLSASHLVRRDGRKYKANRQPNHKRGTLSVHPQGFGFVQDEESDEEFFIREHNMAEALDGDRVLVGVAARSKDDKKRECEVLDVLERRRTQVVGTFRQRGHFAFVDPDDQRVLQDVYVPEEAFNGAEDGQKVVASIDRFDSRKASPEGRVLRVLGDADDANVRVLALAMSMDVRPELPDEVIAAAEAIPEEIPSDEIERRLDLRSKPVFTIDPDDAKDFDDAIHILQKPDGNYEVGVHIADVSHYVPTEGPIEDEAYDRATSVYLVDRTIPMLPEKLSNGLCSLRPHEDKLAFSCLMDVTPQGEVVSYDIRETVIHSKQRLTYDEAQAYLDGESGPMAAHVRRAWGLAEKLTKERMSTGGIDFGSDEVKVILNDDGTPQEVVRKTRKPANRLVEEFMLLANRTVAAHIGDPSYAKDHAANGAPFDDNAPPFVYRIHDTPDAERIRQLAEYVQVFGHTLPLTDGNADSEDLAQLINSARDTAEEIVIRRAALRAMSKAEYNVNNIGHYGLSFDFYTHFTSPIRRYPDLAIHRLLKRYHAGGRPANEERLTAICEHCSEQEREAEQAERESVKLKKVEYAARHVGNTYEGVVSGATKFGVFVEITDLLVEGLVHVREMDDDYYAFDESTYTLRGENYGRSFRPGDTVQVKIIGADIEKREVDLVFVDDAKSGK
ncbi:ribonuclease R [Salisaeta longa]|uniref:ribonuclease R n=1 Tax=Salisaeta longa TaxID=503170 RepID=UPI0003B4FE64|nr:ribonuclease R [Salisaeta longa]